MFASAQNRASDPRSLEIGGVQAGNRRLAPILDSSSLRGFIMTKRLFVTLLTLLTLIGATASITGCNTMEGVGKDVQHAGGAIQGEANEHR
jgi:predicted small secreted protein